MLITVFRCNHYNNLDARWQNISKRAIHHEQRMHKFCYFFYEREGGREKRDTCDGKASHPGLVAVLPVASCRESRDGPPASRTD